MNNYHLLSLLLINFWHLGEVYIDYRYEKIDTHKIKNSLTFMTMMSCLIIFEKPGLYAAILFARIIYDLASVLITFEASGYIKKDARSRLSSSIVFLISLIIYTFGVKYV